MKIIYLTFKMRNPEDTVASGSVIELDYQIREMQRRGHEVTCVTVYSVFNELGNVQLKYPTLEENISTPHLIPAQLEFYKILKKYENQADIFQIDGQFIYGGGLYRLLGGKKPVAAYIIRPPLVNDSQVSLIFQKRYGIRYEQKSPLKKLKGVIRWGIERFIFMPLFASRIDFVFCTTAGLLQEHRKFGLKPARYGILIGDTCPMDDEKQKSGFDEYTYQNHIGTNKKTVLFQSGRMARGKGFDLFIEAFSKVKNKEDFHVILGGDGPERSLVERMIKELALEKYFTLTGWVPREEYFKTLHTIDAYVFPCFGQNICSISLTEIATFGISSIVPRGTGLHWTVGDGGLTFEKDNPNDLARKIEEFGADLELRRELSRKALLRVKQPDMDINQTIPAIANILTSVAQRV